MKNMKLPKIALHLKNHKHIGEVEALVKYGLIPRKLKSTINEMRSFGFIISRDDIFMDASYSLLENSPYLDIN